MKQIDPAKVRWENLSLTQKSIINGALCGDQACKRALLDATKPTPHMPLLYARQDGQKYKMRMIGAAYQEAMFLERVGICSLNIRSRGAAAP